MKTILRIMIILLVAVMVAGAFSLAVNNSSSASGAGSEGQPSAVTGGNGQTITQQLGRPEGGDHDEGSAAGGLAGILGTVLKLTGITILVLALQKGSKQLGSLKLKFAQR